MAAAFLVPEYLIILPWYVGAFELMYEPGQLEVFLLGGGLLVGWIIGLLIGRVRVLQSRGLGVTSAWVCFGGTLAYTYALLWGVTPVEWVAGPCIGFFGAVMLCVFGYIPFGSNSNAIEARLGTSHVRSTAAWVVGVAGAFILLNWGMFTLSWAFQYTALFFSSALCLLAFASMDHKTTSGSSDSTTPPVTNSRRRLVANAVTIFGLLVGGAVMNVLPFARVRQNQLDLSSDTLIGYIFLCSGLGCIILALVVRLIPAQFASQLVSVLIIGLLGTSGVVLVSEIMGSDLPLLLFFTLGGLLNAVLLHESLKMARETRRFPSYLLFLAMISFLGVLLVSGIRYPNDWIVAMPIALVIFAISCLSTCFTWGFKAISVPNPPSTHQINGEDQGE